MSSWHTLLSADFTVTHNRLSSNKLSDPFLVLLLVYENLPAQSLYHFCFKVIEHVDGYCYKTGLVFIFVVKLKQCKINRSGNEIWHLIKLTKCLINTIAVNTIGCGKKGAFRKRVNKDKEQTVFQKVLGRVLFYLRSPKQSCCTINRTLVFFCFPWARHCLHFLVLTGSSKQTWEWFKVWAFITIKLYV